MDTPSQGQGRTAASKGGGRQGVDVETGAGTRRPVIGAKHQFPISKSHQIRNWCLAPISVLEKWCLAAIYEMVPAPISVLGCGF
jgi:hypothetical protein